MAIEVQTYIFTLLILFQFKHFVADFMLQREYMLRKTLAGWDFLLPLSTHCFVHGAGTAIIVAYYKPELWWLALLDFIIHFFVDRIKSGPRYLGRYNDPKQSIYWNIFGLDQMMHHLTHIYIIYIMLTHSV